VNLAYQGAQALRGLFRCFFYHTLSQLAMVLIILQFFRFFSLFVDCRGCIDAILSAIDRQSAGSLVVAKHLDEAACQRQYLRSGGKSVIFINSRWSPVC
jgi:hypothetical protein